MGVEQARAELWRCPECGAAAWHSTAEYPLPGGPALCTHPTPIYERFVPAEHSDALAEAVGEMVAADEEVPKAPVDEGPREAGQDDVLRVLKRRHEARVQAREALTRYRQATPASTGKESGE